jgi:hypothetical protein
MLVFGCQAIFLQVNQYNRLSLFLCLVVEKLFLKLVRAQHSKDERDTLFKLDSLQVCILTDNVEALK